MPGAGRSMYDRILVLASSTPPAGGSAAGAGAAANRPALNRFGVPPAVEPPDQSDSGADTPDATEQPQVNPFANAFGQPGMAGPFGQPALGNPFGQPIPQGGSFFQPLQPAPGAPPATGGFFGAAGSATPGVVQQPVQPAPPPGSLGTRPRPQG